MKKGWSEVALGEVVQTGDRSETPEPGVTYRQLGVRLWGGGAYERESIDGGDTQYPLFNRCEAGDLVVNKIWARNGSVSVVPPSLSGCFVSPEFPIFIPTSAVLPAWLRLITKAKWFWTACDEKARGTSGKNRIKPTAFLEIKIPLPPLAEQQRLTARLDAIEARLTRVQKLREEQEQELQAALTSAFHNLEKTADWIPMSRIAPLVRREVEVEAEGVYPELGIRSFGKGTFHKPAIKGIETTKRLFRIETGDLVFSNVFAWEGAVAVAQPQDHGRFGSHRFISCVCDPALALPEFVQFYFGTVAGLDKLGSASPGGAGRNRTLGIEKLADIQVPIVPLARQQEFKKLLDLQQSVRRKADQTATEAATLLPSLLDQIFTH